MCLSLLLTFACAFIASGDAIEFEIVNNEGGEIWIGIQGNPGHANLVDGGFKLPQGQSKIVEAQNNWAGRFWARTWCNGDTNHCLTGDCGNKVQCNGAGGNPPATLAEITLQGDKGQDFYDISLVDGFNVKASMEPFGGSGDCKRVGCDAELKPNCPSDLTIKQDDQVVGCESACNKYNTDQYCCRGQFDQPGTCKTEEWTSNSARYFKSGCPDAYSYAYDDQTSTFTCTGATKYKITFG